MLDALGIRTSSSQDALRFLDARDGVLSECEERLRFLESVSGSQTELITFGDTIILCLELPEATAEESLLPALGEWLRIVMLSGFSKALRLRGAIAIGEYIHEGATVLGPAIGDAASWYERVNWMGIVATPSCGHKLTFLKERIGREKSKPKAVLHSWFVEYLVPLSDRSQRTMWSVSWPAQYLSIDAPRTQKMVIVSGAELFRYHMSTFAVPLGTEDKYSNTVSFFEWYRANFPEVRLKLDLSRTSRQ